MKLSDKAQIWKDRHFGMFIHYGLYSIPGGVWNGNPVTSGYSEQIYNSLTGEEDIRAYKALTSRFAAENFNAPEIVSLAKAAGMTYIVITTKHHDGFCLFKTETTQFNSCNSAAGRDLVAELSEACAAEGMGLGLYFSWIDWDCASAVPLSTHNSDSIPEEHQKFNLVQMEELLTNYGPICEVWLDMGAPTKEQSREMGNLIRTLQPGAMINGRIWNNEEDFIVLADNEIPRFSMDQPWQTPASIYHETWGYRSWQKREDLEGKIREQIRNLSTVSALGGNLILNIGPMGDGSVVTFEEEVLKGIGLWLSENREAVFSVEPGFWENATWGFSTIKGTSLYLHVHRIPESEVIVLEGLKQKPLSAVLLGTSGITFPVESTEEGWTINIAELDGKADLPVIKLDFDSAPEVQKTVLNICGGREFLLEGEQTKTYQGKDYYSYKPLISKKTWTVKPESKGRLTLDIECPAGQTIEILISSDRADDGEIIPLEENQKLKVRLD